VAQVSLDGFGNVRAGQQPWVWGLRTISNHVKDQQNIDPVEQAKELIVDRIESGSSLIVLALFGLWCVPRSLIGAKANLQK